MDQQNHKRFTYPVPFTGAETKSSLEAMLAQLARLGDSTPFEKDLADLLKASQDWFDLFKSPGPLTFAREKPLRASLRTEDPGKAIDGDAIQSFMEAGHLAKAKRAAKQILRGMNVKETVAEEARSQHESAPATFALKSLALIAQIQGDTKQAEKAYRLLVKIYSTIAGHDAVTTIQYKYLLAEFYAEEEPGKAVDLLEQVIDSCERLGTTGSTIYAAAKSLAGALLIYDVESETLDEAASHLSEAEALQTQAYATDPESWWRLAATITRLAQLAEHRGEGEEARGHYERAIGLYRDHVEVENSQATLTFASLLMGYGECLLGLGENSRAIRAGKESVELVSREFGPLSVEVIPFLMSLGHLHEDTLTSKGAERARRVFKKVVVLHEQHFRNPEDYLEEAPNLLAAHKGIITAYTRLRSYEKAEIWARRAIRVINDLDDGSHELHQIYKMLAFICESDGRPDEAQRYEGLAREVSESLDGELNEDDDEADEADEDEDDEEDKDEDDQWWRGGPQSDDDDA